jgi:hypothetical protein
VIYGVQQGAPDFQVSGVSGTLWQGKVDYVQWAGRGHTLPLGELKWQLSVLSLLASNPCVQFSTELGEQYLKGNVCFSIFAKVIRADEINIALPVANVAPFFGINLGGNITAIVKNIALAQDKFTNIDAKVLWKQASVHTGSEWVSLGNLQSEITEDNSNLSSQWRHVETANKVSPLRMNIRVDIIDALAKTSRVKVKGYIKPSSRDSALKPMLQFMGNKNNDGSYSVDFTE